MSPANRPGGRSERTVSGGGNAYRRGSGLGSGGVGSGRAAHPVDRIAAALAATAALEAAVCSPCCSLYSLAERTTAASPASAAVWDGF
ncbi:MAG: hypothetical protein R2881_07275 [Eubacteriales bacterium]